MDKYMAAMLHDGILRGLGIGARVRIDVAGSARFGVDTYEDHAHDGAEGVVCSIAPRMGRVYVRLDEAPADGGVRPGSPLHRGGHEIGTVGVTYPCAIVLSPRTESLSGLPAHGAVPIPYPTSSMDAATLWRAECLCGWQGEKTTYAYARMAARLHMETGQ